MNWLFIGNKPVEFFSLSTSDQPVIIASLPVQSRATGTSGVFLTRTQMENKLHWKLMCGLSPVTGESPIRVSVKIKNKNKKKDN